MTTVRFIIIAVSERRWKSTLVPQLGLEEDEQALEQIGKVMPDREIIGIPSLEAVRRGGGLNCISWNVLMPQEQ